MQAFEFLAPIEAKFATRTGELTGYGSTFGNVDLGGDIVAPGAFTKSISEHEAADSMPSMLWSHDPSEPIGVWLDAREDAKGLLLTGKLSMDVQRAAEARALAKDGALALSIGFQTRDAGYDKGRRILKDVRLLEVSLVSMPMNPQAKLIDVKGVAASEIRSAIAFERFLKAKVLQTRWRAVWRLAGMPQSVVVTRTRKNFSNKSAPTHRASMEPNMTDLSEIKTAFDENAKAVTKSINEACAE